MLTKFTAPLAGALLAALLPGQSPCFDLNIGTDLNLTDDSTAQGLALGFSFNFGGATYTDVCVCSNGYIWLGPTSVAGGDFSPTEAELLAGAPRICPHWMDFNPGAAGSGHIYFNAVPAQGSNPAYALVTWADVIEFGRTSRVSMQVKLDANHNITITYGANAPLGGTTNAAGTLVGASPGNNAAANPVTFATRPLTITQDTFSEIIPSGSFGLANVQMGWFATTPGYQVADVPCTPNTLPGPAQYTRFGRGCPNPATVYEVFPANTVDLSNLNYGCFPNGAGGYVMVQGAATPFFTGFTNNLAAGDDTTHVVALPFSFPFQGTTYSQIIASSNGFIYLGTTNGGSGCCAGSSATLLSGPPRIAAHWTDLFTSPGGLFADLDPATGDFCVTWNNVSEFGASAASNTFQIALKANGTFDLRFQNVVLLTHTSLTGFSVGTGSQDPGGTDLSAITTLDTGPAGTPADLHNVAGSLPRFGQTMNLEVSGLSAQGGVAFLALTGGAPTAPFSYGIPNNPALAGTNVVNQALGQDPTANVLGFKFSNAVRLVVGL